MRVITQFGLNIANKFISFYAIYLAVLAVLKLIQVSACSMLINMTLSFFDLLLIIPQGLLFLFMPSVLTWILLVAAVVPSICDVVFFVAEY